MRFLRLTWLIVILFVTACGADREATSNETGSRQLTVDNVAANLTLPTTTGAVYLQINNDSNTDDALIGASIPGCGVTELHEMRMDGDVMIMRQVAGNRITIPAGETVLLEPGGLHIMCLDKTGQFTVGQKVEVTLQFENAGAIRVEAEVISPGEMPMHTDGHE